MEKLKLVDRLWLSRLRAVNPERKKALKHRHAQGVKPIENIVYMKCKRK